MRVNIFSEDVFTEDKFKYLYKLTTVDNDIFSELTKIMELDPETDFKYSDLSGVDFKSSDIRGYNFTGADLRGCTGVDVIWDETTNFSGAEISGSMFAYEFSKRNFLSDGVWHEEYKRRNKDYWTKNIEWFSKRFTKDHRDRTAAIELAKAVCDGTSDAFLRSQLLFFLAPAFDKATDHRDYLIHNLSKYSKEAKTVRVTLQALASLYNNDIYSFGTMLKYLDHKDDLVRDTAMKGILRSKYFAQKINDVTRCISQFGIDIRQLYLSRISSMFGVGTDSITDNYGRIYDINAVIRKDSLYRSAFIRVRSEEMKRIEGLRTSGSEINIPEPEIKLVQERANYFQENLNYLLNNGVPLRLGW